MSVLSGSVRANLALTLAITRSAAYEQSPGPSIGTRASWSIHSQPASLPLSQDKLGNRLDLRTQAWVTKQREKIRHRQSKQQPCDRLQQQLAQRLSKAQALASQRAEHLARLQTDVVASLPVGAEADRIIETIQQHAVVVLTGETGSGKTTQVPKMCLQAGFGQQGDIVVTQPRRVAAQSAARRLAEECQAPDEIIASAVRFADRRSADTVLAVVTDGLLLAELQRDPYLWRYEVIIIDEAHERSLQIDLLLGMLVRLRQRRPDLRLIIMSASIDAQRFASFLGEHLSDQASGASRSTLSSSPSFSLPSSTSLPEPTQPAQVPLIEVGGRSYPVDIHYRDPAEHAADGSTERALSQGSKQASKTDSNYVGQSIQEIEAIHESRAEGGILVFFPTERDILEARRRLQRLSGATVLPLYGRLNNREQQAIFAPCRGRRIVLATNIAETSITVPDIRFVIDTGLARMKRYAAAARTERLPIEAVSQASCLQRAGRAGEQRQAPAFACSVNTISSSAIHFTQPEIQRSNLAGVLMQCLDLGLENPESVPWLDAPSPAAWRRAAEILHEIGAIERKTVNQQAMNPKPKMSEDEAKKLRLKPKQHLLNRQRAGG